VLWLVLVAVVRQPLQHKEFLVAILGLRKLFPMAAAAALELLNTEPRVHRLVVQV
jgi:hypothetical protein